MKKLFKYYLMLMAAVLTVSLASCSNDDELLDIDDEEEMFDPEYYDCELKIMYFDQEGTEDVNAPDDELLLKENRLSYVYYSESLEVSIFSAIVATTDDDIRGKYNLKLCMEDNFKKLRSGDVLKDFTFGLNWIGDSNPCSSFDEDHNYRMEGTIRVEKIFKNSIVLNFENFSAREIHPSINKPVVYTVNGRIKFKFAEDPNK